MYSLAHILGMNSLCGIRALHKLRGHGDTCSKDTYGSVCVMLWTLSMFMQLLSKQMLSLDFNK